MPKHRITTTRFASVYPLYVAKAERKGRSKAEVDAIIRWLTGYSDAELAAIAAGTTDFETFFAEAPALNPTRAHHGRCLRRQGGGDRRADHAGNTVSR